MRQTGATNGACARTPSGVVSHASHYQNTMNATLPSRGGRPPFQHLCKPYGGMAMAGQSGSLKATLRQSLHVITARRTPDPRYLERQSRGQSSSSRPLYAGKDISLRGLDPSESKFGEIREPHCGRGNTVCTHPDRCPYFALLFSSFAGPRDSSPAVKMEIHCSTELTRRI